MLTAAKSDPIYGHLSSKERRFVGVLQKRAEWLARRIGEASHDLTYDKQERAALQWALGVIANARKNDEIPTSQELV